MRRERVVTGAMLGTMALFVVVSLTLSWRKWADIQVDFGRELYVPWQLSRGQVLYRDLPHLFGPLSQYFNALLFTVFGSSYQVLFVADILFSVLFLFGLFWFFSKTTSRLAAFVCCLSAIAVFLFSQLQLVANFNFVSPYAHEATHGVILSFLLVVLLWQAAKSGLKRYLHGAAFIFGLVMLTKVEVTVAASSVVLTYFITAAVAGSRIKALKDSGVFLSIALIPGLLFLLFFSRSMSLPSAARAMVRPWILVLDPAVTGLDFYRRSMGLNHWGANLLTMLLGFLVVVIPLCAYFYLPAKLQRHARRLPFWGAIGVLLFIVAVGDDPLIRALPMLVLSSIALLSLAYLRSSSKERKDRFLPLLLWAVFSFTLSWKILLYSRLHHYGFYLTLPSAITVIVMLTWFLPTWVAKVRRTSPTFLVPTLIVVGTVCAIHLMRSSLWYSLKDYQVGEGADRIITFTPDFDPRGPIVAEAMAWLQVNLEGDETFTVLPEGVMINYLLRRATPGRYLNYMPPELAAFGEGEMLQDLTRDPPDYVVLMHKETAEYGVGRFGEDERFGREIMAWVERAYDQEIVWGAEPLRTDEFGIKILKHRTQPSDRP